MKHLLWCAVLVCASSVAAERHAVLGHRALVVKSTSPNISSTECPPEGVFDVGGIGVFPGDQFIAGSLSFAKGDSIEGWKEFRFKPVVPGCFPDHRGLAWQTGDHEWLDSMRVLPGYPDDNILQSLPPAGWRVMPAAGR